MPAGEYSVHDTLHRSEGITTLPRPTPEQWPWRIVVCVAVAFAGLSGIVTTIELVKRAQLAAQRAKGYACGSGGQTWTADGAKRAIPGIDYALIDYGWWSDGRTVVVLWTDLPSAASFKGGSSGHATNGGFYELHLSSPHDVRVDFRCDTEDGYAGTVTVNGANFDLAQGTLFLVSTTGERVVVRQLARGPLTRDLATFKKLASTDAEIRDFFIGFRD